MSSALYAHVEFDATEGALRAIENAVEHSTHRDGVLDVELQNFRNQCRAARQHLINEQHTQQIMDDLVGF